MMETQVLASIPTINRFDSLYIPSPNRKRKNLHTPCDDLDEFPAKIPKIAHPPTEPSSSSTQSLDRAKTHNDPGLGNPFFTQEIVGLFDKLTLLGSARPEELNLIGKGLVNALNILGEKLNQITLENISLKKEIGRISSFNDRIHTKNRRDLALKTRADIIREMSECQRKTTVINSTFEGHNEKSALAFLKSKSKNVARGFIKPQVKLHRYSHTSERKNIEIICRNTAEKKSLETELRSQSLSIRQAWPKRLIAPLNKIRTRFSELFPNQQILIRPHDNLGSLNISKRDPNGFWHFCENINIPSLKNAPNDTIFQLKSNKIQTQDIFIE